MDIALLSKMIKEIILDEDEVTLPGIGTFIAEIVPSSFSDKGYTINPPYRRLYFTQKQGSDTLLADFYSSSNSVSRETAGRITTAFLQELKETLRERKTLVFPGLGRLRATRENYFFFVADENLDIYPYGFGLETISLKTHQETPEEVAEAVSDLPGILEAPVPEEGLPVEPAVAEPVSEGRFPVKPGMTEGEPAPVAPAALAAPTEPAPMAPAAAEPAPAEPVPPAAPAQPHTFWKVLLWILIVVLALAALALGGFLLLAHYCPDLIDTMLYSPEELEIIRSLNV